MLGTRLGVLLTVLTVAKGKPKVSRGWKEVVMTRAKRLQGSCLITLREAVNVEIEMVVAERGREAGEVGRVKLRSRNQG